MKNKWKKTLGSIIFGAGMVLGGNNVAKAVPIPMDVNSTYTSFSELDSSHDGLERRFDYEVTNLGDPNSLIGGEYQIESMKHFEVSSNEWDEESYNNQRIYDAKGPDGWDVSFSPDGKKIIFSTPSYYSMIFPKTSDTFSIYVGSEFGKKIDSDGVANAYPLYADPFEEKKVNAPMIPEPSTVSLLGLGSLMLIPRKRFNKTKSI